MTLLSNLRTYNLVSILPLHTAVMSDYVCPRPSYNYWGWITYFPCPSHVFPAPMFECIMSTFTANVDAKKLKYLYC